MQVKPLRKDLQKKLSKYKLEKKFNKQIGLFKENPKYGSLNTEKLEPKQLNLYSFRIDKKWRAIFIIHSKNKAEIIDINPHYK